MFETSAALGGFREVMNSAHRQPDPYWAADWFGYALQRATTQAEHAEALQMMGVSWRNDGRLEGALECGARAVMIAQQSNELGLLARAQCDLAITWHLRALFLHNTFDRDSELSEGDKQAPHAFRQAKALLRRSITNFQWVIRVSEPGDQRRALKADLAVARGALGLLTHDLGYRTSRITKWGYSSRQNFRKRKYLRFHGIQLLERSYSVLSGLDNQAHTLNTLLRLMQCLPATERLAHLGEALKLADSLGRPHGDVFGALRGRRSVIRGQLRLIKSRMQPREEEEA